MAARGEVVSQLNNIERVYAARRARAAQAERVALSDQVTSTYSHGHLLQVVSASFSPVERASILAPFR